MKKMLSLKWIYSFAGWIPVTILLAATASGSPPNLPLCAPPREIFPIPQIAKYQNTIIQIPGADAARINIVATAKAKTVAGTAMIDMQRAIQQFGHPVVIHIGEKADASSLTIESYNRKPCSRRG